MGINYSIDRFIAINHGPVRFFGSSYKVVEYWQNGHRFFRAAA